MKNIDCYSMFFSCLMISNFNLAYFILKMAVMLTFVSIKRMSMFNKKFIIVSVFLIVVLNIHAQRIVYSEPDRDDSKSTNFEIIGKMNEHYLVYKSYRGTYNISVLDADMKLVSKEELSFLPDRVINVELLSYKDFFYVFYQFQKRSIVYFMAAKMNADGKKDGSPIQLDTTSINFYTNNKIYTLLHSEDKQKILALKINSKNEKSYLVTSILFDQKLNQISKNATYISMPEKGDYLSDFAVDNDGDLGFVRAAGTSQNESITKLTFIYKKAAENEYTSFDLDVSKIFLDDIKVKVDNINKHFIILSFYSKSRRGNVEGLYSVIWDKKLGQQSAFSLSPFSEEFRSDAKSEGNSKYAFNDFFLQDIIPRKDGGYVVASECVYSSSRNGNPYNRWDYMYGSPFWSPSDYYLYSSPYGSYYPWYRGNSFGYQTTRYFADNIAVLSFDSTAKMEWNTVIKKSQYDDNTDSYLGYGLLKTGGEVHFIYNQLERRTLLLGDQSITSDGQLHRSPTFHNLDKGYQFMPRYAKQVGAREMLVPCDYRSYICFAKIDF